VTWINRIQPPNAVQSHDRDLESSVMTHSRFRPTRQELRQRAAEFDRLAAAVRDPVIRTQFTVLKERFLLLVDHPPAAPPRSEIST
jgi:hypothetical protein